jgi:hypothetical protein
MARLAARAGGGWIEQNPRILTTYACSFMTDAKHLGGSQGPALPPGERHQRVRQQLDQHRRTRQRVQQARQYRHGSGAVGRRVAGATLRAARRPDRWRFHHITTAGTASSMMQVPGLAPRTTSPDKVAQYAPDSVLKRRWTGCPGRVGICTACTGRKTAGSFSRPVARPPTVERPVLAAAVAGPPRLSVMTQPPAATGSISLGTLRTLERQRPRTAPVLELTSLRI